MLLYLIAIISSAVGLTASMSGISPQAHINTGERKLAVQEKRNACFPSHDDVPQARKRLKISAMGDNSFSVTIVKFAENSTADLNPSQIIDSRDAKKAKLLLGMYRQDQFPKGITPLALSHIDRGARSKHPAMNLLQNIVILQMYDVDAYKWTHPIHGFSSVDAPAVQNMLDQIEQQGNTTIERFEHAISFHHVLECNIQHFFFDCIPRLWIYKELEAAGVHPIVLISPTAHPYVPETLEMMGFPYRILGKNPVIVDNLYRSLLYKLNFKFDNKDSTVPHLWNMVIQAREAALAHVKLAIAAGNRVVPSHKRVYLSRMHGGLTGVGRQLENEADLATRLEERGFVVLNVTDYHIPQRSELFRDTEVICSLMGAGLTNILFVAPTTNVIIIDHPHFTGNWFNATVGPMFNIPVHTINGLGVVTAPSIGSFSANEKWRLDVDKAIQQVDAILGSHGEGLRD